MSQSQIIQMKPFHTWKANRIHFLAVWNGEGYHITDETGQNFGAWQDLEGFRALQAKHDPNGFLGIPGSWCRVSILAISENPGFDCRQEGPQEQGIGAWQ